MEVPNLRILRGSTAAEETSVHEIVISWYYGIMVLEAYPMHDCNTVLYFIFPVSIALTFGIVYVIDYVQAKRYRKRADRNAQKAADITNALIKEHFTPGATPNEGEEE